MFFCYALSKNQPHHLANQEPNGKLKQKHHQRDLASPSECRPSWQYLPEVPGYVPVYIRNGDTPLEEINPDLAEAFHALPIGRSAGKHLDAAPDTPEQADQPQTEEIPEPVNSSIDRRPFEKKQLEKKKKASFDIIKPVERR